MKKSLLCVVLLAAVPALATISKVQSVATWNATGSSCNLSLPGTGSGHLIVLWVNQADTRDVHGKLAQQSNGVSLYGIAEAYNTNSSAWGINTTTGDNTATSNTYIIGYQNDVWVLGTPMSLYADQVTLNGTTGTVPSSALAYVINNNRTDGQKFQTGFEASDNCCGQAFQVGSATGTSPSASQAISFAYWNGVRKTDTNVSVDSSGNYLVAGPTSFKFTYRRIKNPFRMACVSTTRTPDKL